MPTLRQIACAIELGPGNTQLKEYGHTVTDGAVETYIVAPENASDVPFHVRITSDGYIAPGLSAYVFMDGEYQCNRNRLRLRFPEDGMSSDEYEIDFKLRQKEEKTSDGTFIARDWFFTPLNTGNADKASNMKHFKDNVGTIEVVILRCKDGGGEELCTDPAQTTVSRNPLPDARPPLIRNPLVRASPGRAPSERPAPKSKTDSSVGGMMGIFDGAGDDPGYYKRYRPRNIVGQEHLPGHKWDDFTGQYRYFNDQDPFVNPRTQADNGNRGAFPADRYRAQTYTVGGGFSVQESAPPRDQSVGGPKSFVPQSSPGYDFTTRRRKVPPKDAEEAPKPTYDFTRRKKQESQQQTQHNRQESMRPKDVPQQPDQLERPGKGFAFVEDSSHLMEELIDRFSSEKEKYAALSEDAERYQDRKDIHNTILKAAHRKYAEIVSVMNELGSLYRVVKEAMDSMDRITWRRASDLLYEKDLYPPPEFEISSPPKEDAEDERKAPRSRWGSQSSGFEQVGQGTFGKPGSQNNGWDDTPGKSDKAKASWANFKEASAKKSNSGWGNDEAKSQKSNSGWGNAGDDKPNTGWDDTADTKKVPGAWGSSGDNKPDDDWAKDDKKSGDGGGGGGWDTSNKKSKTDDGWGNNNAATPKADSSWGGGADNDKRRDSRQSRPRISGSVNDGAGSDSYSFGDPQPKPVIKPYWSEWTKKQVMAKPKVQPREVYEYPALPLPALPRGKTDKGITQAVHAGRGANYAHKLHRPEYLDSMSKPYAIFTFKYRSKAALEAILKHNIRDSEIAEAMAEAKKHRLLNMRKDELVEELMKKTSVAAARSKAASKAASNKDDGWGAPASRSRAASNKDDGWGPAQSRSRAASNKQDPWDAPEKKPSSHRRSPSKGRSHHGWDSKDDVKPSDSVSQAKTATGWGASSDRKNAKDVGDGGWGANSKQRSNKDKGSKSGKDSCGWGASNKPDRKGTSDHEHWAGNDLPKTGTKSKFAGW